MEDVCVLVHKGVGGRVFKYMQLDVCANLMQWEIGQDITTSAYDVAIVTVGVHGPHSRV